MTTTSAARLLLRSVVVASPPRLLPHRPQHRAINRHAAGTTAAPVTPFNDPARPLDEAIPSRTVHHVDEHTGAHRSTPLASLLASLNRADQHVQQVGQHSDGLPVVKVRSRQWLREHAAAKELQRRAQAVAAKSGKELELSWGVDENDLGHRMRKLAGWLREGRTVEVMIARKRGGRAASGEEMEGLVGRVREAVGGVEGAAESKEAVGRVGRQLMLTFKGTEVKEGEEQGSKVKELKREREEKMRRKEEEKARKRKEAEEKKARAVERARERMEKLKGS